MPKERQLIAQPGRSIVVQGLSFVEDVVYIGLGVLLTIASVTLLWVAAKTFVIAIVTRQLQGQVVGLLDQILLILLIVELLYTVQVSFRAHGLLAEPFLVVALIAVIRRILVLTAEVPKLPRGRRHRLSPYPARVVPADGDGPGAGGIANPVAKVFPQNQ